MSKAVTNFKIDLISKIVSILDEYEDVEVCKKKWKDELPRHKDKQMEKQAFMLLTARINNNMFLGPQQFLIYFQDNGDTLIILGSGVANEIHLSEPNFVEDAQRALLKTIQDVANKEHDGPERIELTWKKK